MVEADLTPIKKIMQSISGLWHEQWTDDTLRKALNVETVVLMSRVGEYRGCECAQIKGFRALTDSWDFNERG